MNLIDVIVPLPIRTTFTYIINKKEFEFIDIGFRVMVPFGKSKFITGIVVKKHQNSPINYNPKEIEFIIDKTPIVTLKQLTFFQWISDYYMCPLGLVLKVAVPKLLFLKSESEIVLLKKDIKSLKLSVNAVNIFNYLIKYQRVSLKDLTGILDKKNISSEINELIINSIITVKEKVYDYFKPKFLTTILVNSNLNSSETIKQLQKKKSQLKVFKWVGQNSDNENLTINEIINKCNVSRQTVLNLINSNILLKVNKTVNRSQFLVDGIIKPKKLSSDQNNAYNEIKSSFKLKNISLLHGVTSSGKTEIYVKLITEQIEKNNQILYLVPEIALTTQLISRLKKYFGENLLVYHSKYTLEQRTEIWKTVLNKPGKIILGARSSIFLPFKSLSLIIIDEEHENA